MRTAPAAGIAGCTPRRPRRGTRPPGLRRLLLVLLCAGAARSSSTGAETAPEPVPGIAVILTFDQARIGPDVSCAGRITSASGTRIRTILPILFEPGETVSATDHTWRCRTRGTRTRPGRRTQVLQMARDKGLFLSFLSPADGPVRVATALGDSSFVPAAVRPGRPLEACGGRILIRRAPDAIRLGSTHTQDDFPGIACGADGTIVVAWQTWNGQDDGIGFAARRPGQNGWRIRRRLRGVAGDLFRPRPIIDGRGRVWVIWAWNRKGRWDLFAGQVLDDGTLSAPHRLTNTPGVDFNHSVVRLPDGRVLLVWQAERDGQYDILVGEFREGRVTALRVLTDADGDDRDPAIAVSPSGTEAAVVWDSYRRGSFNVYARRISTDLAKQSPVIVVAGSPRFEAHAAVAYDGRGRLWVAWTDGGLNWGKHGRPLPRLHAGRRLVVRCLAGDRRLRLPDSFQETLDLRLRGMWEEPVLVRGADGYPILIARHLMPIVRWHVKRKQKMRQSRGIWSNFAVVCDGTGWSTPVLLYGSDGRNMQRAAAVRTPQGEVWAVWAGDGRRVERAEVPRNNNVFVARIPVPANRAAPVLEKDAGLPRNAQPAPDPRPPRYTTPIHGDRNLLLFGDLHRHTDISRCAMNFDGSLIDTYRYAQNVVHLDFLGISDHDQDILKHRYDRIRRPLQGYMWWRSRKFCDLYTIPGRFTAIYGYEHGGSMKVRGGHKNVFYADRDNPCIEDDAPEALFKGLQGRDAVAIPHQLADGRSATDWTKWSPEWEPVAEMFQARGSYEYLNAPRPARVKLPGHYVWDALQQGIRIGLIASSDHGLVHSAYACVYARDRSRAAILDALRKRHTYAATDTILLDLRVNDAFMGETVETDAPPRFHVRIRGTGELKRVEIVRDARFIYNRDPDGRSCEFDFVDVTLPSGRESWYYVRCIQENGEIAWSSPVWVRRR